MSLIFYQKRKCVSYLASLLQDVQSCLLIIMRGKTITISLHHSDHNYKVMVRSTNGFNSVRLDPKHHQLFIDTLTSLSVALRRIQPTLKCRKCAGSKRGDKCTSKSKKQISGPERLVTETMKIRQFPPFGGLQTARCLGFFLLLCKVGLGFWMPSSSHHGS